MSPRRFAPSSSRTDHPPPAVDSTNARTACRQIDVPSRCSSSDRKAMSRPSKACVRRTVTFSPALRDTSTGPCFLRTVPCVLFIPMRTLNVSVPASRSMRADISARPFVLLSIPSATFRRCFHCCQCFFIPVPQARLDLPMRRAEVDEKRGRQLKDVADAVVFVVVVEHENALDERRTQEPLRACAVPG